MEPIIISIAQQIIVVVVLSLLAGFAIGWLSVRAKYKAKYDYEATRDFFRRKPLYEWHTSIPCPGAFLICEVEKNRLIYGYAVSDGEGVAIMQLPDRVNVFDQDVTPRIVPYSGVRRWSYAEDHPIYPSEALRPYSQSYKKSE